MNNWYIHGKDAQFLTQDETTKNRIVFALNKHEIPFTLDVCGLLTRSYVDNEDIDDFRKQDLKPDERPIIGLISYEINLSNLTLDEINTKVCYNFLAKPRGMYSFDFEKDKFAYRFQVHSCLGEKREAFLKMIDL